MSAHDAVSAQRRAADPAGSVWVAANAGSGKTRVLTERVARLLLEGAPPQKILCLTYTKAAAAEMRARLFAMLGDWAMMEEGRLAEALTALTGAAPEADLAAARRLFAEALETPGGLKIQTIHAFCDSLLRRFPLEAGAPPAFTMLEEREQAALIDRLLDEMAETPAFGDVAALIGEEALDALAGEIIRNRARFPERPDEAAIAEAFDLAPPVDEAAARLAALEALNEADLGAMIAAYAAGTAKEQEKAAALRHGLEVKGEGLARAVTAAFLTADGEPRKERSLITKSSGAAEPNWRAIVDRLTEVAVTVREKTLAAAAADRAIRLARFGGALVARYEAAKAAAGHMDFDDLVSKAEALLTRSDMAEWALFRLDGGVDHILVDEAQDTAPAQWRVIRSIAAEFHAGLGAREERRTLFVVGDEKQSIYSFQGAAPGEFDRMRRHFDERFEAVEAPLRAEALAYSFRSAPAILRAVDATFDGGAAEGLSAAGAPPEHLAFHDARAGRVELWPLIEPDEAAPEPEPWAPVDLPAPREPRVRLAGILADQVAEMLAGARLPGGGRRVTAGDIIILLQNRPPMMAPLIAALKARGVPVAGADRLKLMEELAVKDLLAILRFAATPEDDLTLAALLRSPIFDVDEDGLFDLAHPREGGLWPALRAAADRWPREVRVLERVRSGADFLRPYEMLERVLTEEGGRQRMIARLGPAAEDPIDELLAQALAYEQIEPPSLEGFLGWMARGDEQIKREQEGAGGEVRVMTVHGAKGLEAPVVILPDTMRPAAGGDAKTRIAEIEAGGAPRAAWRGDAKSDPALLAAARARAKADAEAEHRRLLYVAMTRAEDWLIVCGARGGKAVSGAWWDMVRTGMDRLGATEAAAPAGLDGAALIFETGETARGDEAPEAAARPAAIAPDWAGAAPPPSPRSARRPIAASRLAGAEEDARGGLFPAEIARRRGEAIHAALEIGAEDIAAARSAAEAAAADLAPEILDGAAEEAFAARATPGAERFFAPDAIAEAAVSLDAGGRRIVGRIDRLIVSPTDVAFVDFKSDAAPPDEPPSAYLAQIAAYRAALQRLHPGLPVRAAILWTAAPRLDWIDDAALDAAQADLGRMAEALDPPDGAP